MTMHSWLSKLVRPSRNHPFTRKSLKGKNRARLTIEGLEDRWVPATYTVLNTNDTGAGSLRDAVAQANANIGADTIVFGDGSGSGGTNFLDATADTITLTSGDITFAGDTSLTTVTGPGANLLTISGGNTQRAFWVNAGISTSISGMTLTGGRANGTPDTNASAGAAVYNAGTLDLTNVTVSGNSSTGTGGSGKGGAVHSQGNLTLTNCIVSGNTGNGVNTGNGSGILAISNSTISNNTLSGLQVGGGQARLINTTISGNTRQGVNAYLTDLMMANCTVSGNSNSGDGAGVLIGLGSAALTNCTITGNNATGNGGGILLRGTVTLTNCTISGNSATIGGGVDVFSGTPTFVNTIVAGNTATNRGPDVGGTSNNPQAISSLGNNLIGKTDGSSGWSGSDLTGTIAAPLNAQLGTLSSNGGTTQTLALLSGSPAINAGNSSLAPSEVQDIAIYAPGGSGTFTVTFNGQTTGQIAYNAGAGTLQTVLNALSSIGGVGGSVTVTKFGNVFRVTFGGTLANQDLPQMTASGSGGATATVLTLVDGNTDQRGQTRSASTDIGSFETQFKVYTTADTGSGSLRQAIANANASTGTDTIVFSSLFNTAQTITLTSGALDLTDAATTTISGTYAGVTVSGNNASGVFKVNNGASAALSRLTITGGNTYQGGGLWNDFGNVTITDSAVINNTASFGGGLDNVGGTMVLTNVTLSGNTASNNGGAIDNVGATLTLVNTTISGNTAAEGGGLRNNGTASISNTIIAGNTAPSAPDVWNSVNSLGNNLIGKTDGSSGWVGSDLTGTIASPLNSLLGGLADNGGPTQTIALLSGSPAINAGNPANAPATDQRGLARSGNTDIGAYETQFKVYTTSDSGNGSLRQAIANANSSPGADDIVFSSLFNTAQTITLTTGQITFTDTATTTVNDSSGGVTVSGNNAGRVFFINTGASVSIKAMTITGGLSGPSGGAIANAGDLTLTYSTVSGNISGDDSGAIANFGGATLNITNSTFANNTTANDGGAIRNGGKLTITNSTFSGNHSGIAGGGIRNDGTMTIANTIVAGNSANQVGPDVYGTVGSSGTNLIGKTDNSSGWVGTDLTGTIATPLNAQLGSLTDNGGPTKTMALLPGSPAINAGDASRAPVTDQRGQVRFGNTDIGAFEYLFKVTNTANAGNGSLRSAITNANAVNTLDTIIFKIPGSGVQTITPFSALPTIVDPVIIDGTSASGYAGTPVIEIVGASAGAGVSGLTITSSGSTISGLAINRFSGSGIVVTGGSGTGNVIKGNYLGIGTDGVTDLGNTLDGITISAGAANNTIGGIGTNDRNVISGNTSDGIEIRGAGTDSNIIIGNYIGLNAAGTSAVRNDGAGVFINTGPQYTQIGTNGDGVNDANERNVISGNSTLPGGANINIVSANHNRVSGNFVGTNASGTAPVINGGRGIRVATGSSFNIIGTDGSNDAFNANERNLVSGNNSAGIFLAGNANDNMIAGNWVGLDATGSALLGNNTEGISISGSKRNIVGTNADGVDDSVEANVVVGSGGFGGVFLADPGNQNNIVAGNFIGTNPSGTSLLGSQPYGVSIGNDAHDNRIGGVNASERNIISGSSKHGIYVVRYQTFPTGYNTTIQGNYIGTDVSGTIDFGNANDGVMLENSYGNIVGGTAAGAGNLISGNNLRGVEITGSLSTANTVLGNRIGTDITGNSALPNSTFGVLISAGATGNSIGGSVSGSRNTISGNSSVGVMITGSGTNSNTVAGNYIGLNASGNAAVPNLAGGVRIRLGAQFNLIGTNADGINDVNERNVISGNINHDGVAISNPGTNFNVVSGNYLGTDRTGTFSIGNSDSGVSILSGAQFNRVGTNGLKGSILNAAEGNLISGNGLDGVYLENASNNTLAGNIIGLNANGSAVLGNGATGVIILGGATGNTIGTNSDGVGDAEERNWISGNLTHGIQITGSTTTSNVVAGNFIGTDKTGTLDRGNLLDGVHIDSGAKNQTIGGSAQGAGNLIRGNFGYGIVVSGATTTDVSITNNQIRGNQSSGIWTDTTKGSIQGNTVAYNGGAGVSLVSGNSLIRQNSFIGNTGLGIDVGAAGLTPNDSGDLDSVLNAPVLTVAHLKGGLLEISGFARPGSTIEFYIAGPDATQFGEGTTYLATLNEGGPTDTETSSGTYNSPLRGLNVGTDSTSRFSFLIPVPDSVTQDSFITALTIDPVGGPNSGTSEFSANITPTPGVVFGAPLVYAGAGATILEGGTFAGSGTFTDLDSTKWSATVDYGDGSSVQTLLLNPINYQPNGDGYTPSATGTFDLAHVYSKAGTYSVNVKVTDDAGNAGNGFSLVVVNSAPAQIDDSNITVSPSVINEGGSVTVTGKFTDPSSVDHHSVMITWGDGTVSPADSIDEVNRTFTATHVYSDDKPKGTESDVYSLQVAITDNSSAVARTTFGLFYVQVNNVRPSNLTLAPLTSTINENGFVTLGGTFSDPGILDQHLVTINWGDGSPVDVIPLVGGILNFSGITHQYLNNPALPATSYGIQVSVTDDDEPLRPATATTSIIVTDTAASNLQIVASPSTSSEGSSTSLSGTFFDPGTKDRHKVIVNWGDGSPISELVLPAGVTAFSGMSHTYLDNPAGQPSGAYTIQVTVTDANEPAGAPLIGYKAQTVINVAPSLGQLGLTRLDGMPLDPSNLNGAIGQINENDEVLLTGSFGDLGRLDNQVVTIDWGDGSPLTTATVSKATSTFQASHRFVDNAVGTIVSLDSIRVTITDNDGGSSSSSVDLAIANVAPQVRILSGGGTTAGVTLKADADDVGPIDASELNFLWTVSGSNLTGTGSTFTLPAPTAFQSYQVTLTVTDNDGVSTSTTTSVIVLDDNANTFEIPAQPAGVSSVTVFGLGGNDIISAGKLLVDGFNRIIFDADGIPFSTDELSIPVILDGGSGQDTLIGGSADDTIYLQQGNDTAYGQQGNDKYLLKPNSTLTVVDGSGFNSLDFGLADFGSNVGVTFNLQQTSGQVQDVAPVGTLAGHHFVSANDLGTGTFTTLIGSSFDDNLTAASGATLFGGAGADTFNAVSSTVSTLSNAIFYGGADGDFLITSGPGIGNLTFNGDDGVDTLQNLGVITGSLIFNGGADADVINNSPTGVILGSPTFNGDDGVFTVTNQGNIQGSPTFNGGADGDVFVTNFGTITGSPIFNGGADAEVLVNQPGGVISGTPTFNGDDGVIFITNNGTINGTPTFIGGADADSFTNGPGGVITGALVFNGDDGANTITNFGVILGTPTFIGGADADVFTNSQGGVISGTPIFTGGADADSFINAPGAVISGNLVFNGDTGADLITNYGSITGSPTFVGGADGDVFTNAPGAIISGGMTFNGDDGANTIVNFGAITGSATFIGGADADVFTNASGAVISGTPIFTGGSDADTFVNSVNATISGNLTFNGDDGADTVVNSGTIGNALGLGTLTFHGGADGDAILNPGTILGSLSFNGDDGADMFYNGANTVGGTPVAGSVKTLTFNGDAGADLLINPNGGSIGTLTFGGGADGDVLTNQGVILGNTTFNGDDGADFLTNNGTIGGTATFVGGADADTFVNTGPIGTLSFIGDLGADRLYNSQNSIRLVSFNAGAGNDLFINDGSGINTISFVGGAGNDVFGNTGANLGTVTFRGDDGADTFVNTGNTTGGFTTSLTFGGGADQDTLINKGSSIGTGILGLSFSGDDGADTLVNQGSNIGSLIFSGGADSDGFLNSGANVGLIRFTGDDGADVLRNDGTNLGILIFSGGADGDVLANYGAVVGALSFNGDDGADSLRNSGVISGTISFNGDDGSDLLVNHSNGVISGPATFNGGADSDTFVNSEGGSISGSLTFNGDDGADLVGNAGVIPGSVTFNGGADADSIVNVGAIGGSLTFSGDDGADAFYNGGYVNGVFIGGSINTLTFNGDDGADVLANPAGGTIATLTFGGGADGDVLSNLGVVTGAMSFQGDSGADVLVNQVGGVINGPLTYNGGADADSLYNQPGAVIGGQGGGLTFNGDQGADSLVNAGTVVGVLTFTGGADADTLTNAIGGIISGPLTVNGDDGADQVNNQMGAIIGNLTFNGGADGDFLANQGTINGNLNFNGDDGANTLTQGGLVSGSLSFTGGADADTLTTTAGSTIGGSLTFTGDDGADTLIVSGVIAGSLVFSGGSDADVLILGPTGSAGFVEAHAGDDKDHFIIAGGGGSFLLDGGAGDDTYTFAGLPTANITISESYTGNADGSSDTLDFSAYTGGSLVLDLALTTPQVLINNRFTLTLADSNGMENVIGTPQADTVYGNDRPNLLTGAAIADDRMFSPSATPPQGYQAISRTQWVLLDFDTNSETGEHVYTDEERAAIQARIESVYHGPDPLSPWFDVKFTQDPNTIPSEIYRAGQFATIFFNRTPSFNRPGGESSEVDFGNTNLDGYASVQVNGLVGGDGQPADTSDHFVRLSAKIAAHELAHLLGVRHSDSFGPIGLGLHSPPGTEKFGPDYPGPAAAYETFDHIISSPASVGSDRFNDLRDLYFGPREAIKLTFDQKGVTLPESVTSHSTIATATPIDLYALTVPNTATTGLNAGKSFQVGAVNVSGNLKIDPSTGRAESDYYALSGNKGDILTLQVDSTLLARLNGQETIDSVLSVYDAQGNLVPYYGSLARNDDQFEPTDSLILDLVLPATGTYYVQVASFSRNPADPIFDPTNPASPLNPSNLGSSLNPLNPSFSQDRLNSFLATLDGTDTGAYGLFIYRFSSANPTDQSDYLNGRAGNDTLKGGLGTDILIGGAGQDDIDSGEGGSGYVLSVTPRETSFDLSLVNSSLQTTLAINDPSGSSFWDVTVDYGDGSIVHYTSVELASPVAIGHTYSTPGNYTALITVQNDDGLVGTSSLSVKVSAQKASSFVVAPVGTGTYGATATIIASLGSDGTALAGKAVSFTFNNGVVITALGTATTDANGVATLTGVDIPRIGAGTYVGYVGANFAGDALYQATSSSGNLIIAKASLTVTADAKTKVYGGADPSLTFTPSGTLFYGDSYSVITGISLTTKTGALATAGTHPIIVNGGTSANYNITTVNGLLTVSQKALTVTANSLSKNFGNTVTFSGNEFTASGLVYSDSLTSVTLSSNGAPASAPVGSYAILPSAPVGTGLGNYSISYSAGVLTVSTRAGSVYLLNPTVSGALNLSGNANLNVIGDLVVDSNSASAITASGNASAKASVLLNMGGISISGDAKVTTPQGRPGTTSDPYASLPVPASTGSALTISVSGNAKQTINPGTYSSIKVSGNGSLTLNPGVYIIAGGGLSVSGNGSITGSGVTIYNGGSNVISTGPATFGGIGLSGNGAVQLSAPLTGPYAGILVFQSRDNTLAISLSGNSALGISGMIYAPKALLSLSGNAQLQSHIPIVVDRLQISGNGSSSLSTEGTGTTAGQLLSGDRALFIDDQAGYLNGNARARINDAINHLEQLLQPYSVTVSVTTDRATADLVLNTATTSPVGGLAQGVLGCYSETGEITLIQGWNWYTGADPAGIGSNQFDFSTIVVHELGHALGLGHSANPSSTMFAALGTGQAGRTLTTADLSIPETEDGDGGHEGLHAVPPEKVAAAPVRSEIPSTATTNHPPTFSNGTMVTILDRVFTVSSPFESQTGSISGILTQGSPLTPKFGNVMINRSNKTVGSVMLMSAAPLVGKNSNQLKLKQTLADSVALEMAQADFFRIGSDAVATSGSQTDDVNIPEMRVPNHV